MTTLRRLTLTEDIQRRIVAVQAALDIYRPGYESAAVIELPKLALADAVLAAIAEQTAAHDAQLAALPRAPALGARLRWKRSRRA